MSVICPVTKLPCISGCEGFFGSCRMLDYDKSGNATLRQVGGSHYKDMAIQPAEYVHRNGMGYIEGCVIKYVSRWRKKNGIEDLRKAVHFLEMLIEMENSNGQAGPSPDER